MGGGGVSTQTVPDLEFSDDVFRKVKIQQT